MRLERETWAGPWRVKVRDYSASLEEPLKAFKQGNDSGGLVFWSNPLLTVEW